MTTSTRRAYINFQLGSGWEDISHLTKYDSFSVSTRAFNDTFHYAQNECQLDILYDATIWNNILSTRIPILLRIISSADDAMLTTENNVIITAESAFALAVEQEVFYPVFYGHIAPETSWSYNGLTSNSIMSLTATDELDTLDVPCGDIIFANYAICDPVNPTTSIVHALLDEIGWDIAYVDPSVTISTVIPRFAPPDPESTVLEVLDTLLYEYGYTLNMSVSGQILPLKWNRSSTDLAEWEFTDANCIKEVTTRDSYKDYDGVSVVYYALKTAPKVLLYRDDNCGYADDGSFTGYNILAGTTYPPETNVIDETTGVPTVVYQEYDDTGIKYKTNKAITEGMDYNYKAFSSDFSAMVATENHFLDARISTGLVATFPTEFYNTKCRIGWSNLTGDDGLKLYFNNVYADVWYKSTERKTTVDIVAEPLRPFSYTSNYIFDKTHGDNLAKGLAKQYVDRSQTHGVTSESYVTVGSLANLVLSDGTSQACLIMSCDFNENTGLYTYQLTRTSTTALDLTSQITFERATIDITNTYPSVTTIGSTSAISSTVPRYRGRYYANHPSPTHLGDWWTIYHDGTNNELPLRGVWWNNEGVSERITTSSAMAIQAKLVEALTDVAWAEEQGVYGVSSDYGIQTLFQSLGVVSAFIQNLFAQQITVPDGGRIRYETGAGVQKRTVQLADEKIDWLDTPDTSPASPEQLRARIGRLGVCGPVLLDGDFVAPCVHVVSPEITIESASASDIVTLSGGTMRIAYKQDGSPFNLVERTWNTLTNTWGVSSIIGDGTGLYPRYIERANGELRITYTVNVSGTSNEIRERIWNGSSWGVASTINTSSALVSCYAETLGGELHIIYGGDYSNAIFGLFEKIWDGVTWGNEVVIDSANAKYPNAITTMDGVVRVGYQVSGIVERKYINGVWDSVATQISSTVGETLDYIELIDGTLFVYYSRSSDKYLLRSVFDGVDWSSEEVVVGSTARFATVAQYFDANLIYAYKNNSAVLSYRWHNQYAQLGAGIIETNQDAVNKWVIFSNNVKFSWPLAGGTVTASTI